MTEVSDTLRKALALIEKPENWCKGVYGGLGFSDRRCAFGALAEAARATEVGGEAIRAVRSVLPPEFPNVESFNDHPDTTHPMVVDLFKRAIAEEEAK